MSIRKEYNYVVAYKKIAGRIFLGAEADISSWSIGGQLCYKQIKSWKYYIGIYFLCFAIFVGIDW